MLVFEEVCSGPRSVGIFNTARRLGCDSLSSDRTSLLVLPLSKSHVYRTSDF